MSSKATLALLQFGYQCRVVTNWGQIDTVELHRMIARAWLHDYRDSVRPDLGEAFLRNLTRDEEWLAAVCEDPRGVPVGFEIAVPRRLRYGSREFKCWYVTAFSVDPGVRRRGIGRWLLETINDAVFAERGGELIFSTFEAGKAGSSTVQAVYDAQGLEVRRFHESPVLVLRADKAPRLSNRERPFSVRRVFVDAADQLRFCSGRGEEFTLPSVTSLDELVRTQHTVSFALAESFLAHLRQESDADAGGYWFAFDSGHWCWMTCTVTRLSFNDASIGSSLLLQTVLHSGCTDLQLEHGLAELARLTFAAGHRALVAYAHSQMPSTAFRSLGFEASGQFYLSVRGPKAAVGALDEVAPPYFVDFT